MKLTITDEKSLINGRAFEYTFARKNRPPALYYIKNADGSEFDREHPITEADVLNGQSLSSLKAEDPDEDQIVIRQIFLGDGSTVATFPKDYLRFQNLQKFQVRVSDGKLEDWQEITIRSR